MKKALLLILVLAVSIISTACINNLAVQELNNKAKEYLDKGDYESAIGRLKSSIDLDSTIFESHYNLGIAYTQAEKYSDAVDEFQKALELNPHADIVYYSLAVAYENEAKNIITPPQKQNDEDVTNENVLEENTKKDLSSEDKSEVVELFTKSIEAYNKYIDKSKNVENLEEINSKVEYLQKEITKYSE